jgi:hypothetical protein
MASRLSNRDFGIVGSWWDHVKRLEMKDLISILLLS